MLEVAAVLIHRAYRLRCSGSRRCVRLALHGVGAGGEFGDDVVQVFVCCGVELALGDDIGDVGFDQAAERLVIVCRQRSVVDGRRFRGQRSADFAHVPAQRLVRCPLLAVIEHQLGRRCRSVLVRIGGRGRKGGADGCKGGEQGGGKQDAVDVHGTLLSVEQQ